MKLKPCAFENRVCVPRWGLRRPRKGSIAFVLIVVIVLALGTFANAIARRQSYERSAEVQRDQIQILETALNALVGIEVRPDEEIRFPVAPSKDRWVIVTRSDSKEALTLEATLMNGEKRGISIQRDLPTTPLSGDESSR
jgi:hypothetical protein